MRIKTGHKGFTLVELLVVISIISLLSSVAIASVNSARRKARDAQRIQDLRTISKALESYYNDNGHYPSTVCGWDVGCNTYSHTAAWSQLQTALAPYLPELPRDPLNNCTGTATSGLLSNTSCYAYSYANVGRTTQREQYDLATKLETPNHPQSCKFNNYKYYFDHRVLCVTFGGTSPDQLYEGSPS